MSPGHSGDQIDDPLASGGGRFVCRQAPRHRLESRVQAGVDTQPAAPSGLNVPTGRRTTCPDRSGQLVAGRYRILRRLGEGGMGSVWLAVDCVLARAVALKESQSYDDATASGPLDSAALREARAAGVVSHPSVVKVYDLTVDGGREWIVMEALSGTTLARAISQAGRLPVEQVVDLGLRLVDALSALHRESIIHGDVKPSNVQLDGTGRPVLTDFGLATGPSDVDVVPPAGPVMGSPPYLAPEVIRTGSRSPTSDLFALGATLYEAAEGRRPFHGDSPTAAMLAVLHQVPEPTLHGTPLGQVIDGLLVKEPGDRLVARDAFARLKGIESELVRPWSRTGSAMALAC
jgi:eukaryotic-like serine/threonine-protein kinase